MAITSRQERSLSFAAACLAMVASGAAAQTMVAASVPPPASTSPVGRDPVALPGDALPPTIAASLAPPRPAGQRPPEVRPVVTAPPIEIALQAAQAALARCQADALLVGAAVADASGNLVTGLQMTGANPGRIFFAARKAVTAAQFGAPTSDVREKLRAGDFSLLLQIRPNMVVYPGGVPLRDRTGKVIGAIGVSGATAEQDEICAAAGAAAVRDRL